MSEILDEFKELLRCRRNIDEKIEKQKQLIIDEMCPVKIGDIVEVNGFTFTGKQMRVDRIVLVRSWKNTYKIKAVGKVLKKDGTVGQISAEWYGEEIKSDIDEDV